MISDKLLAHILDDAYIKGAVDLEGNSYSTTVNYLKQFVKSIKDDIDRKERQKLPETDAKRQFRDATLNVLKTKIEGIEKLLTSMTTVSEIQEQLMVAVGEAKSLGNNEAKKAKRKAFSKTIAQRIQALKPNEQLAMPGGWTAAPSGHAMIYTWKKDAQGNLFLYVWNTGGGLNYHEKDPVAIDKQRFCPAKVYKISANNLPDINHLTDYVEHLVRPNFDHYVQLDTHNATKLYEECIPKISIINGELQKASDLIPKKFYTAGQRSGTCAEKSLHLQIKLLIDDLDVYNEFIYTYKKYALEDYLKDIQQKTAHRLSEQGCCQLVDMSLQALTLKIPKLKDKHPELVKDLDRFLEIKALLTYKDELGKIVVADEKILDETYQGSLQESLNFQTTNVPSATDMQAFEGRGAVALGKNERVEHFTRHSNKNDFNLKTTLEEAYVKAKRLSAKGDRRAAIQIIEDLFLNLPIYKDVSHNGITNVEDGRLATQHILNMMSLYQKDMRTEESDKALSARSTTVILSMLAFNDKNSQKAKVSHSWSNTFGALFPVIKHLVDDVTSKLADNPYMASSDPDATFQLSNLVKYFEDYQSVYYRMSYEANHAWVSQIYEDIGLCEAYKTESENLRLEFDKLTTWDAQQLKSNSVSTGVRAAYFAMNHNYPTGNGDAKVKGLYDAFEYRANIDLITKGALDILKNDFTNAQTIQSEMTQQAKLGQLKARATRYRGTGYGLGISEGGFSDSGTILYSGACKKPQLSPSIKLWLSKLPEDSLVRLVFDTESGQNNHIPKHLLTPEEKRQLEEDEGEALIIDRKFDYRKFRNRLFQANDIQVSAVHGESKLTDKGVLLRQLFHLRSNKTCQLTATLDFFDNHMELLDKSDYQLYFLSNVFHPTVIHNDFKDEDKVNALIDFLRLGVRHHTTQDKPTENAMFFIETQLNLFGCLAHYQNSDISASAVSRVSQHSKELLQDLNTKIEKWLTMDLSDGIKQRLHTYRYLIAAEMMDGQKADEVTDKHLAALISSNIARQYLSPIPGEINVSLLNKQKQAEFNCRELVGINQKYFNEISGKSPKLAEEIIKNVVPAHLIPEKPKFSGVYPFIICQDKENIEQFRVNIETGRVISGDWALGPLPVSFYSNVVYQNVFGNTLRSGMVSASGRVFKIKVPEDSTIPSPGEYKVLINDDQTLTIHRKIKFGGEDAWYEYQSLSQKYANTPEKVCCNNLPLTITERNNRAWVKVNGGPSPRVLIIDVKQDKVKYVFDGRHKQLHEIDEEGQDSQYSLLKTDLIKNPIYQSLSKFEDPNFIQVFRYQGADRKQPLLKISLPRYKLELHAKKMDNAWHVYLADNPKSKLVLGERAKLLSGFDAGLLFEHENIYGKKEFRAILPVQKFYVEQEDVKHKKTSADQIYFQHHFDRDYHVNLSLFNQLKGMEGHFNYTGLEHIAHFDVKIEDKTKGVAQADSKLKLEGKSNSDMLYLAYVYLNLHQSAKAFECLQAVMEKGGITGDLRELEMLQWLIEECPAKPVHDKSSAETMPYWEKTVIKDPNHIAVRMQATALLSRYKIMGGQFDFPKSSTQDIKTAEQELQAYKQSRMEALFNGLDEYALELFELYDNRRRITPVRQRLKLEDELQVLRLIHLHKHVEQGHSKAFGIAGDRWLTLETELCHREKRNLESLDLGADNRVVQFLKQRLSELQTEIQQAKKVARLHTNLESKTVSANGIFRKTPIGEYIHEYEQMFTTAENGCFELLTPGMTPEIMLQYFKHYYDEAKKTEGLQTPKHQKLVKFVNEYIQAYYEARTIDPELPDLCLDFCLLLKKVLNNPGRFSVSQYDFQFPPQSLDKKDRIHIDRKVSGLFEHAFSDGPLNVQVQSLVDQSKDVGFSYRSDQYPQLPPKAVAPKILDFDIPEDILVTSVLKVSGLLALLDDYHQLNEELAIERQKIEQKHQQQKPAENFLGQYAQDNKQDEEIGRLFNLIEAKRKALAVQHFAVLPDSSVHLQNLKDNANETSKTLEKRLASLQKAIEELSNYKIIKKDSPETILFRAAELGGMLVPRSVANLLAVYTENNVHAYLKDLKLSDNTENREKIDTLHSALTEYLSLAIKKQQYDRIHSMIEDLPPKENRESYAEQLHQVCGVTFATQKADPKETPARLVSQYVQNILMRDQQEYYINSLLEKSKDRPGSANKLIQLIMGGGKTKVIIPQVVKEKANGTNLVVVEVPTPLFATNLADFNITSQQFNQTGVPFLFNRDSDDSSKELEQLYHRLRTVVVNKDYLVTTGESVQSLELKYNDLLDQQPAPSAKEEVKQEWANQIYWIKKCVNVFRHQGDVIIDEIDSGLDTRKKLIYSIGDSRAILTKEIKDVVELFDFFKKVSLEGILPSKTMHDVVLDNEQVKGDKEWAAIFDILTKELVYSKESPLKDIIQGLVSPVLDINAIQQTLDKYLRNNVEAIPSFVQTLPEAERAKIALYKEQVNNLLPLTLKRKLYEHYGPTQNPAKSVIEKQMAIPYMGNLRANERCKFGNRFEGINYTIQLQYHQGFSFELFEQIIGDLIEESRIELIQDPAKKMEETTAYLEIQNIFRGHGDYKLTDFNPKNIQDFKAKFELVKKHPQFLTYCLTEHILRGLKVEGEVIEQNAANHVDIYRSVQGVTGTTSAYRTFHQSIQFDKESGKGTDGITKEYLRSKKTAVNIVRQKTPAAFIDELLPQIAHAQDMRAIIDVGAVFRGISNRDSAREIAQKFASFASRQYVCFMDQGQKPPKYKVLNLETNRWSHVNSLDELHCPKEDIVAFENEAKALHMANVFKQARDMNHVLYFNEENYLCALTIPHAKHEKIKDIFIGSSNLNVINEKLGSTPKQRLTYYDQSHTRGTDVKQMQGSIAITTIDKKTREDDFLQGVMRMRDFANSQSTVVVMSEESAHSFDDIQRHEWQIEHVLKITSENQAKRLGEDHFRSTLQKMENVFRNDLMIRILNAPNLDTEVKRFKAFRNKFFVKENLDDVFKEYGGLERERSTKEIIKEYQKQLFSRWEQALKDADLEPVSKDTKEVTPLKAELKKIRNTAADICFEKTKYREGSDQDSEVESQQEVQIEQEVEQELEAVVLDSKVNAGHQDLSWCQDFSAYKPIKSFDPLQIRRVKTLNEVAKTNRWYRENAGSWFDGNILVSPNFYETTVGQDNFLNAYAKPVHFVLMMQKGDNLSCLLVTQAEAELIFKHMQQQDNAGSATTYCWLTTPRGSFFAGKKPRVVNKNYNSMMEQIQYFNGDLDMLAKQKHAHEWLSKETTDKLNFFEKHIQPHYVCKTRDMKTVKKRVSITAAVYKFIVENTEKNLSSWTPRDWTDRFPGLDDQDVKSIQNLANAIKFIQTHPEIDPSQVEWDKEPHLISTQAMGYLTAYIRQTKTCLDIFNCCKHNKTTELTEILSHSENVSLLSRVIPNPDCMTKKWTPLLYASQKTVSPEIFEIIVRHMPKEKLDQCAANLENGSTALHYAVFNKDIKKIEALIKQGAGLKVTNLQGKTIFDIADPLILKQISKLVQHGFSTILESKDVRLVEDTLIGNPQLATMVLDPVSKTTALLMALENYKLEKIPVNAEIVDKILEFSPPLDQQNKHGIDAIKFIGQELDSSDPVYQSILALHKSSELLKGHLESNQMKDAFSLLETRPVLAKLPFYQCEGLQPIHFVVEKGDVHILQYLHEQHGVSVIANYPPHHETMLHMALKTKSTHEVISYLLSKGCSIMDVNLAKESVIGLALQSTKENLALIWKSAIDSNNHEAIKLLAKGNFTSIHNVIPGTELTVAEYALDKFHKEPTTPLAEFKIEMESYAIQNDDPEIFEFVIKYDKLQKSPKYAPPLDSQMLDNALDLNKPKIFEVMLQNNFNLLFTQKEQDRTVFKVLNPSKREFFDLIMKYVPMRTIDVQGNYLKHIMSQPLKEHASVIIEKAIIEGAPGVMEYYASNLLSNPRYTADFMDPITTKLKGINKTPLEFWLERREFPCQKEFEIYCLSDAISKGKTNQAIQILDIAQQITPSTEIIQDIGQAEAKRIPMLFSVIEKGNVELLDVFIRQHNADLATQHTYQDQKMYPITAAIHHNADSKIITRLLEEQSSLDTLCANTETHPLQMALLHRKEAPHNLNLVMRAFLQSDLNPTEKFAEFQEYVQNTVPIPTELIDIALNEPGAKGKSRETFAKCLLTNAMQTNNEKLFARVLKAYPGLVSDNLLQTAVSKAKLPFVRLLVEGLSLEPKNLLNIAITNDSVEMYKYLTTHGCHYSNEQTLSTGVNLLELAVTKNNTLSVGEGAQSTMAQLVFKDVLDSFDAQGLEYFSGSALNKQQHYIDEFLRAYQKAPKRYQGTFELLLTDAFTKGELTTVDKLLKATTSETINLPLTGKKDHIIIHAMLHTPSAKCAEVVSKLLAHGASADGILFEQPYSPSHVTPIEAAIDASQPQVLNLLLMHSKKPAISNRHLYIKNQSTLDFACSRYNQNLTSFSTFLEALKYVIDNEKTDEIINATVSLSNSLKKDPLQIIQPENMPLIHYVLQSNLFKHSSLMKDIIKPAFCELIANSNLDENIIKLYPDLVQTPELVEAAIQNHSCDMLKLLVKFGADSKYISNRTGENLLFVALRFNDFTLANKLIAKGADINFRNDKKFPNTMLDCIGLYSLTKSQSARINCLENIFPVLVDKLDAEELNSVTCFDLLVKLGFDLNLDMPHPHGPKVFDTISKIIEKRDDIMPFVKHVFVHGLLRWPENNKEVTQLLDCVKAEFDTDPDFLKECLKACVQTKNMKVIDQIIHCSTAKITSRFGLNHATILQQPLPPLTIKAMLEQERCKIDDQNGFGHNALCSTGELYNSSRESAKEIWDYVLSMPEKSLKAFESFLMVSDPQPDYDILFKPMYTAGCLIDMFAQSSKHSKYSPYLDGLLSFASRNYQYATHIVDKLIASNNTQWYDKKLVDSGENILLALMRYRQYDAVMHILSSPKFKYDTQTQTALLHRVIEASELNLDILKEIISSGNINLSHKGTASHTAMELALLRHPRSSEMIARMLKFALDTNHLESVKRVIEQYPELLTMSFPDQNISIRQYINQVGLTNEAMRHLEEYYVANDLPAVLQEYNKASSLVLDAIALKQKQTSLTYKTPQIEIDVNRPIDEAIQKATNLRPKNAVLTIENKPPIDPDKVSGKDAHQAFMAQLTDKERGLLLMAEQMGLIELSFEIKYNATPGMFEGWKGFNITNVSIECTCKDLTESSHPTFMLGTAQCKFDGKGTVYYQNFVTEARNFMLNQWNPTGPIQKSSYFAQAMENVKKNMCTQFSTIRTNSLYQSVFKDQSISERLLDAQTVLERAKLLETVTRSNDLQVLLQCLDLTKLCTSVAKLYTQPEGADQGWPVDFKKQVQHLLDNLSNECMENPLIRLLKQSKIQESQKLIMALTLPGNSKSICSPHNSSLQVAIQNNLITIIPSLLHSGLNLDYKNELGDSAMKMALSAKPIQQETIMHLLKFAVDNNHIDAINDCISYASPGILLSAHVPFTGQTIIDYIKQGQIDNQAKAKLIEYSEKQALPMLLMEFRQNMQGLSRMIAENKTNQKVQYGDIDFDLTKPFTANIGLCQNLRPNTNTFNVQRTDIVEQEKVYAKTPYEMIFEQFEDQNVARLLLLAEKMGMISFETQLNFDAKAGDRENWPGFWLKKVNISLVCKSQLLEQPVIVHSSFNDGGVTDWHHNFITSAKQINLAKWNADRKLVPDQQQQKVFEFITDQIKNRFSNDRYEFVSTLISHNQEIGTRLIELNRIIELAKLTSQAQADKDIIQLLDQLNPEVILKETLLNKFCQSAIDIPLTSLQNIIDASIRELTLQIEQKMDEVLRPTILISEEDQRKGSLLTQFGHSREPKETKRTSGGAPDEGPKLPPHHV